ncbi:Actin-binding Rho-activating protein-like [Homarus americanus]|uniref:Actin-binding Rho-activating protein-like n=1 Tax=Homarus americanus TaxID=6706 RepID=A0A8J5MQW8_HOMAM|nr:Actin-binding Rho-activating protein-like [Homarus americanus]
MSDIDNMGDAHDQPFALRHSSLTEKKQLYDQKVKVHSAKMGANPFSGSFKNTPKTTLSRDDPNYGKPVTGSKSERRGKNAARHINAEVVFLCDMIYQEGHAYEDGTAVISFGDLFQRRDDDVPIALVKPIQEIRDELHKDQEFEVGVCHKADSR